MASISYPGDLNTGEAITASVFNDRFRPLFQALNASGISGADGITDDEVAVGALSPDRIAGTAVTLDDIQTFSGDKAYTGKNDLQGQLVHTSSVEDGSDTTPDVGNINTLIINNSQGSSVTITQFLNGVEGQVLRVICTGADDVVLEDDAGTPGDNEGLLQMDGGNDQTYVSASETFTVNHFYYTDLDGTLSNGVWIADSKTKIWSD